MNRLLLILITLMFVVSCDTSKHEQNPVSIAISPWAGYSFALIAKELGYLKVNGKDQINIVIYPSLSESRLAYINGNVDGFFSTMIEVIESAQQENKNPNIVLVTNFSNGPDQILSKQDIKNIDDLKGKRIGVEPASIGMYMLNRALEMHKISYDEVTLVHMGSEFMEQALKNNTIDAAISYPPYTQGIIIQAPNSIFDSSNIQDEIIDLLSIEENIIDSNPEHIRLFIKGWIKAYDYYLKNPVESQKLLQKYPEFSRIDLANELKSLTITDYRNQSKLFAVEGALKNSYANITQLMKKQNLISRDIKSDRIIDETNLYPELNADVR